MTNNSLLISIPPSQIGGIAIATLLFAIALFWFSRRKDTQRQDNNTSTRSSSVVATQTTLSKSVGGDETKGGDANSNIITTKYDEGAGSDSGKLRNVFSVKQKPINTGNGGSSSNKKKGSSSADNSRPFESSYYFAHNKHSTGCVFIVYLSA